jgi:hypothetical protein
MFLPLCLGQLLVRIDVDAPFTTWRTMSVILSPF